MELTRSFTADQFARALESWDWADIQGKQPLFTSPFGDVFFQAQDGFWFLDLLEGTLTRPWSDADALQAELNTARGRTGTSWPGWRSRPNARASSASARQVLSFKVAPVLGAAIAVENMTWLTGPRGQGTVLYGQRRHPPAG